MEKIKVKEILEATESRLIRGNEKMSFSSISTDTRTLKKGSLFVALKGKNFDGHDFVPEAIKKGAKGIIISRASCIVHRAMNDERRTTDDGLVVIEVKDTLRALQDIANYYRRRFKMPLIAVTGSNGKTTTKEMIWNILSLKSPTLKNKGNYNNEIGVPLTLFELSRRYQFAVLEFGSNAPGEIKRLAEIAEPTIGVVTNIGMSHTEGLSDINGVAREKLSLFAGLRGGGNAIVNLDDRMIHGNLKKIKKQRVTYGIINKGDVRATDIGDLGDRGMEFMMNLPSRKNVRKNIGVHIPLIGKHNVYNALAAAAVASFIGISPGVIKKGLESIKTLPMRMEIVRLKGTVIINDAYNANPDSVEEAISIIKKWNVKNALPPGRKILILGDMLELGKLSVEAHKKLSNVISRGKMDTLFTIGKLAAITAKQFKKKGGFAFSYSDKNELVKDVLRRAQKGDIILIKGSRAMKMEEVARSILSKLSKQSILKVGTDTTFSTKSSVCPYFSTGG